MVAAFPKWLTATTFQMTDQIDSLHCLAFRLHRFVGHMGKCRCQIIDFSFPLDELLS